MASEHRIRQLQSKPARTQVLKLVRADLIEIKAYLNQLSNKSAEPISADAK